MTEEGKSGEELRDGLAGIDGGGEGLLGEFFTRR